MGYRYKLQVIQRGGQNRQYYLICPAPMAAALETGKRRRNRVGDQDRNTFEIRRLQSGARAKGGRRNEPAVILEGALPGLEAAFAGTAAAQSSRPAGAGRPRVKPVDRSQLTWQTLDVERLIEAGPSGPGDLGADGAAGPYGCLRADRGGPRRCGRTPWDPRLLVSLWIYAYSRGISSAREIARRCTYEPAFQWLCGLG